jgi:uncharacterized protein (DUF433 family)
MSTIKTRYEHIHLNENGVPLITGANMKVIELVLNHKAYGWSPEELHFQHTHLTMGQIHSALAYYWDHQTEMDQAIELRLHKVDQIESELKQPSLKERLQAKGTI